MKSLKARHLKQGPVTMSPDIRTLAAAAAGAAREANLERQLAETRQALEQALARSATAAPTEAPAAAAAAAASGGAGAAMVAESCYLYFYRAVESGGDVCAGTRIITNVTKSEHSKRRSDRKSD
eukprot:1180566-Prorocentrum_minimum.AAC.1